MDLPNKPLQYLGLRDVVSPHSKSIFSNFFTSVTVIHRHNVPVLSMVPTQTSLPRPGACRTFCVLGLIVLPHSLRVYIEERNNFSCPEFVRLQKE